MGNLAETTLDLVSRILKLLKCQDSNPRQRMLVALAGVPGSGKSTVSGALLEELASRGIRDVAIVPMVRLVAEHRQSFDADHFYRMASITPKRSFPRSKTQLKLSRGVELLSRSMHMLS